MEEVCKDYETLELDIPGGDGEKILAESIHGFILWDKWYIILKTSDQASRPVSPARAPTMSPQSSPPAAPQYSPSPSSPRQPPAPASPASPTSPPPSQAKKQKQPPKKYAPVKEPPKKKKQPPKKAKAFPTKPWDKSYEECKKAEVEEKRQPIDPSQSAFFIGMTDANRKRFIPLSDYDRSITK
jgi:hypothetical protein